MTQTKWPPANPGRFIGDTIIAPIFLMFFEPYNDWLDDTYGRGSAPTWPPVLNFARVLRNSIAHNGIHFRNPEAPPVSWRTLSYGPANEGKKIIGRDMSLGDVLGLMFEADEALRALNAPIL